MLRNAAFHYADLDIGTYLSRCKLNTFQLLDQIWTKIRILDETHSWYSELNPLQNLYFGFFLYFEN